MSEHTPGPWRQQPEEHNEGTREVLTPEGDCIADVWPDMTGLPVEANACLISAAPELLEAAKAWERWEADLITEHQPNVLESMSTDLYDRMLELQIQRNSAIDKAEGRS